MTLEEFGSGFAALEAAFPNGEVTDATRDVWWRMLEPMPAELFNEAVERVLVSHRWHTFPAIAEIVEVLDSKPFTTGSGIRSRPFHGTGYQKLALLRRRMDQQRLAIGSPAAPTANPTLPYYEPSKRGPTRPPTAPLKGNGE